MLVGWDVEAQRLQKNKEVSMSDEPGHRNKRLSPSLCIVSDLRPSPLSLVPRHNREVQW